MVVKFNSINEGQQARPRRHTDGGTYNAGNDKATRYPHCLVDNGNGTVTVTPQRSTGQRFRSHVPVRSPTDR